MRARDIMTPDVITAGPETAVSALAQLMLERRISAVPILDQGALVGLVSEGDLLRRPELGTAPRARWLGLFGLGADRAAAAYAASHGRRAAEVMSRPVISATPDAPLAALQALMQRHRIKRLPIVDGGRLIGILTRADLLRALVLALAAPADQADGAIRDALLAEIARQPWAPAPGAVLVLARDGTLHLAGTVASEAIRAALIAAAEATPGARGVDGEALQLRRPIDPMDRPHWFDQPPP